MWQVTITYIWSEKEKTTLLPWKTGTRPVLCIISVLRETSPFLVMQEQVIAIWRHSPRTMGICIKNREWMSVRFLAYYFCAVWCLKATGVGNVADDIYDLLTGVLKSKYRCIRKSLLNLHRPLDCWILKDRVFLG